MQTYQCKDSDGRILRTHAEDPESACRRVANVYRVTVVAVRPSRDAQDGIRVGAPGPDSD